MVRLLSWVCDTRYVLVSVFAINPWGFYSSPPAAFLAVQDILRLATGASLNWEKWFQLTKMAFDFQE
jgi:hypothetical protein